MTKKEKKVDTEATVDVCSAKSEGEILREIINFFGRYFLIEVEEPSSADIHQARSFAKLTLRLMTQMKRLGMDKEASPIFAVICYMQNLGQGVHKMSYAPETIGGEMFVKFGLSILGEEMDKAFKAWHLRSFGEELSDEGTKKIQAWSGAIGDECKES